MLLLLLFLAVPLIEIALFIQLGSVLALGWILLIVVLTAVLGTWLVRQQGRFVLSDLQRSLSNVSDPTEPLAHGAMVLFSGALLLTPGFFTDTVGFLLLIPTVRAAAFRWIRARMVTVAVSAGSTRPGGSAHRRPDIIDGDYHPIDPDRPPTPRDPPH